MLDELTKASGCIFDCDGTLLDSMDIWNKTEEDMVKQIGYELTFDQLNEFRSAPIEEGARLLHEEHGVGTSNEDVLRMMDDSLLGFYRDEVEALPGVKSLLDQLKQAGIPCTVVTSSPRRYVQAGLERNGIDGYFVKLITTDEAGLSKSDPAIYAHAVEVMESDPATTWGFDDALYAIEVMARSGLRTVAPYACDETGTKEQLAEAADMCIMSFEEIA